MNISKIGKISGQKVGKITRHCMLPKEIKMLPTLEVPSDSYGKVLIGHITASRILSCMKSNLPAFKKLTADQKRAFEFIEDIGKSIQENTSKEQFVDFAKDYIEKPSASAFFRTALSGEYSRVRLANYPILETEAKNIAEITSKKVDGIISAPVDGWHYRGRAEKNTGIRISINAKADEKLIENLDKVLLEEKNITLYKTPSTFEGWHKRHDPITIYLGENPSEELIAKLAKATEGHIRSEENLIGKSIGKGMTLDVTPSQESLEAFIDEVTQYDTTFATYLRNLYFSRGNSLRASSGEVKAAKNVLERLKQNYPETNSFSKSIGQFSFKEDPERTVEQFVTLVPKRIIEIYTYPESFSGQLALLNNLYRVANHHQQEVKNSKILMDFIKEFPNSLSWTQERFAQISEELDKFVSPLEKLFQSFNS